MPESEINSFKDIVFYIPRKIIHHFETYKIMQTQTRKDKAIIEAYRRRLNCIKITAEQNHYGNENGYKRKIIELATTPIDCKF